MDPFPAKNPTPFSPPLWLAFLGLWGLSLGFRLWGLGRFNTLVFDELYFAKFAHNYLTHTPFFDAHPPLGKYLIALGIWLRGFNPWGYRWMNAVCGSMLPLLAAGIGWQLTRRPTMALLAGSLALLDGLSLVESRYALMNVYLLLFGLSGHWCIFRAATRGDRRRWMWLTFAGSSFGAAATVKWNGLGFLLGLYLFWGLCRLLRWLGKGYHPREAPTPTVLHQVSGLSFGALFLYLPGVAALVYGGLWLPHLRQNPNPGFWALHAQILSYHQRVGNGPEVHPYCSTGLTWPFLLRPVSYFYQRTTAVTDALPTYGPPLPAEQVRYVYSVYATGNPPLWWATTLAIALVMCLALWRSYRWLRSLSKVLPGHAPGTCPLSLPYIPLYLASAYGANLLPWLSIHRCAFLYHYMPAYFFSSLALSWVLDYWRISPAPGLRIAMWTILGLSVAGFIFWLPFYLGLPLTPTTWQWRIWLRSWV